jgi:ubiquitin-protein ligase
MAKKGRLLKEMKMMNKKNRPGVFLSPVDDSMDEFEASMCVNVSMLYDISLQNKIMSLLLIGNCV